MPQFLNLRSIFRRLASRIRRSTLYLLLGIGISLLVLSQSAHASETVILQYLDRRISIPRAELVALASEQEISPELQQFLQQTRQDPAQLREWLTTPIRAPQLSSEIAPGFALLQINKVLGDPLGRENLEPLKVAFAKAFEKDKTFSILEILEDYPEPTVRLALGRLGRVYADVNQLVTRIQPVLKVADALLPELLCNCNIANNLSESSPQAIAYAQNQAALKSLWTNAATSESTENTRNPAEENLQVAQEPSDSPALANKRLVIDFGPLGRSISLADLTHFAETGEISRGWRFFFNLAGINPEEVRTALNQQITVKLKLLDKALNNLLGEFALYEIGQVLHTPSNTANIQALRSAAILSVVKDDRLSLLEILQRYPTQQVHLDGARLARLGRHASRFRANGGITTAVLSLEDWLVQLQASEAEKVCTCEQPEPGTEAALPPGPTIAPEQIAEFLPPNWQPVAAHREDHGIIKVVWQQGTPYEMGYQHGQYLHDEIAALGNEVLSALRFAGRGLALGRLAAGRSFPDVVEECRGLSDATQDIGMTMDACLVMAYGDIYQEIFANTLPNVLFWDGCSQWVAAGDATKDGRIYHGSTLDNDKKPIDYIVNHPVVFIRQPNDGLPHVFITYPGVVWPNWGLNVAGITLGLDSLHPKSADELPLVGRSEVQLMGQILKTATSFAEARQVMETQPSGRANLIMATDSKTQEAGVFEVIGKTIGVRPLQPNGVLYTTNHAVLPETFDHQQAPLSESSLTRFKRFAQLMEPNGSSSLYGQLDPANMVKIGRDRINPNTGKASPLDVFDDDASPGGNGSLRQGLYDPENLLVWVAAGRPPVPENPFVCFSIGEMLNFPNATPCASPAL